MRLLTEKNDSYTYLTLQVKASTFVEDHLNLYRVTKNDVHPAKVYLAIKTHLLLQIFSIKTNCHLYFYLFTHTYITHIHTH